MRLVCLAFVALVSCFYSCKNTCKDVTCLHGGTCSEGACNCNFQYGGQYCDSLCPTGYTGEFCDIEIRQQFIRQWSATISSPTQPTVQQPLNITAGSAISYVNVNNFEGFNFTGVIATGNSFSFAQYATGTYTGYITGSGVINGSNLLINVTRQDGVSYVANCNP